MVDGQIVLGITFFNGESAEVDGNISIGSDLDLIGVLIVDERSDEVADVGEDGVDGGLEILD